MRYRLGSFNPRPGSHDYADLLEDPELGAPMTQALEEMLGVRLSYPATVETSEVQPSTPDSGDHEPAGFSERVRRYLWPDWLDRVGPVRADLLAELEPGHLDRTWVNAAHEQLRLELNRLHLVRLLACEYEPGPHGFLTLAASTASLPGHGLEVLPGDRMQIGFAAMRSGEAPVRVWPRLLREVCFNGSLVSTGEFVSHEGEDGIGEAIERCFSPVTYEPVLQEVRRMQATAVVDPRDELQRIDPAIMQRYWERIARRFHEDGDDSEYGLMNAVTATAREIPDWRDRLDLEEFAGRMARLKRPVPSRSGGGVLIPA